MRKNTPADNNLKIVIRPEYFVVAKIHCFEFLIKRFIFRSKIIVYVHAVEIAIAELFKLGGKTAAGRSKVKRSNIFLSIKNSLAPFLKNFDSEIQFDHMAAAFFKNRVSVFPIF